MEELVSDLIKGLGALIAIVLWKFWEKREAAKKKAINANNHSPEFVIDIAREVKHELRKIRDRYRAMRVYVIHFSNGSVTEMGLPLLKISFKHEVVVEYGAFVEYASLLFQEISMPEMFLIPMYKVFKIGSFYLKDIEELDITDRNQKDYYHWLKSYSAMSVMWLIIRKKGKPAAILVIHWPRPTDLSEEIISKIKDINRNVEKVYEKIQDV